jgi:hypothetical protein
MKKKENKKRSFEMNISKDLFSGILLFFFSKKKEKSKRLFLEKEFFYLKENLKAPFKCEKQKKHPSSSILITLFMDLFENKRETLFSFQLNFGKNVYKYLKEIRKKQKSFLFIYISTLFYKIIKNCSFFLEEKKENCTKALCKKRKDTKQKSTSPGP